jgi:hypothetical protein
MPHDQWDTRYGQAFDFVELKEGILSDSLRESPQEIGIAIMETTIFKTDGCNSEKKRT